MFFFLQPWQVSLVGGTVKRYVASESLRQPLKQQILNLQEMLLHFKKTILSIYFQEIEHQVLEETREFLQQRFAYATTIKGTRSFHNFKPLSATKIATKRINFMKIIVMFLTSNNLFVKIHLLQRMSGKVAMLLLSMIITGTLAS